MTAPATHHATCVALDGAAALITGAAGSGKSALGLQLMALGCRLVADDRVILTPRDGQLIATCPETIGGMIEARGIGILRAEPRRRAWVKLAIDLDQTETERLPPSRALTITGCSIPLLYRVPYIHFASAIVQFLRVDRIDT